MVFTACGEDQIQYSCKRACMQYTFSCRYFSAGSFFICKSKLHAVYIYIPDTSPYKTIQRIQINATSNSIKHAWSLSLYIHDAQCEGKELKGHYIAFSACMFIPCFGSIMPDCVMMASNSQHCIFFFITQQEQPRSQAEFSLL